MMAAWVRLALLLLLTATGLARAHESRPAYLEINEITPARYSLLWRTPVNAGMRLPVRLELPADVRIIAGPTVRELSDSRVEHRLIEAPGGFAGRRIGFLGLQATITDVLVRIQWADGGESTTLVRPSEAWMEVPRTPSQAEVAGTYLVYGIEHILGGIDHLLFVAALLLIVRGGRQIIATVTAFTVAHSLTLVSATMGWVHVPSPPVEAIIALSIMFVAVEIVHGLQGRPGLTSRAPWLVAFCFGLLHGLGFAGALAEVGLPEHAIPMALLSFNLGVEAGQLMFVGMMLVAIVILRRLPLSLPRWSPWVAPYAIGGISAFWMLQRIVTFWQ